MSQEATSRFSTDIRKMVTYYAREFNITYAEMVGVLQLLIIDLWSESSEDNEEKEEDE